MIEFRATTANFLDRTLISMGPGFEFNKAMPSRPKYSWDIKNVPWTDGKGNQDECAESVELWTAFHDALPD